MSSHLVGDGGLQGQFSRVQIEMLAEVLERHLLGVTAHHMLVFERHGDRWFLVFGQHFEVHRTPAFLLRGDSREEKPDWFCAGGKRVELDCHFGEVFCDHSGCSGVGLFFSTSDLAVSVGGTGVDDGTNSTPGRMNVKEIGKK